MERNEFLKKCMSADCVIVDNFRLQETYRADIDVCFEDDEFDGIYFDGECIIDESNIDDVVHTTYTHSTDNGNIVFQLYKVIEG